MLEGFLGEACEGVAVALGALADGEPLSGAAKELDEVVVAGTGGRGTLVAGAAGGVAEDPGDEDFVAFGFEVVEEGDVLLGGDQVLELATDGLAFVVEKGSALFVGEGLLLGQVADLRGVLIFGDFAVVGAVIFIGDEDDDEDGKRPEEAFVGLGLVEQRRGEGGLEGLKAFFVGAAFGADLEICAERSDQGIARHGEVLEDLGVAGGVLEFACLRVILHIGGDDAKLDVVEVFVVDGVDKGVDIGGEASLGILHGAGVVDDEEDVDRAGLGAGSLVELVLGCGRLVCGGLGGVGGLGGETEAALAELPGGTIRGGTALIIPQGAGVEGEEQEQTHRGTQAVDVSCAARGGHRVTLLVWRVEPEGWCVVCDGSWLLF